MARSALALLVSMMVGCGGSSTPYQLHYSQEGKYCGVYLSSGTADQNNQWDLDRVNQTQDLTPLQRHLLAEDQERLDQCCVRAGARTLGMVIEQEGSRSVVYPLCKQLR